MPVSPWPVTSAHAPKAAATADIGLGDKGPMALFPPVGPDQPTLITLTSAGSRLVATVGVHAVAGGGRSGKARRSVVT